MWKFALQRLDDGDDVFVAHVAHHTKHSPGTTGASLAVCADGTTQGTIGGGIMEAEVLELAEEAHEGDKFRPRHQRLYHRRKAPDDQQSKPSGLFCAGNQTNVYHLLQPQRHRDTVADIVERLDDDRAGRVVISSSGLEMRDSVPDQIEAPYQFERHEPWSYSIELLNWKRIAIIGGGHCGLALSRVMDQLGYAVTVVENRPDVFTFRQNDHATHKITVDDYADAADHIDYPAWTHVVVMTANQPDDVRGLYGVADGPYPYIGVMGADAKLARIGSDLRELGVDDAAIDGFYAPIGLPMTSNTPEEIAISIAGEILRERTALFPFTRPDDI